MATDEAVARPGDAADHQLRERLTALLLTIPGWNRNYTGSLDAAVWIIEEADRVGWKVEIE